jgi:tetratricopeptide (TPR) repeat protein
VTTRSLTCLVIAASLWVAAAPARARETGAHSEIYFNPGRMHLQEGRAALAVEQFKKAVQADPKNSYALKGLGDAYLQLGKFDDAVGALRKSLIANPYYVDVHNDLGTALILSGKREDGKNEFSTAFNDPTNPTPELSARNLAQAYFEEKNYPEAANWYRTAINRNRKYPDAYLGLVDALLALNRNDDAIGFLEAGIKELPKNACMQLQLGQSYFRAGRLAEARTALESSRRNEPQGECGKRAGDVLATLDPAH